MHILIDIAHPAEVNFYKRAITELKKKHQLTVLVRPRGRLVQIVQRELDVPFKVVGKHYASICGKIYGLFHRVLMLLFECHKGQCDVVTSFGGFYSAIAARILRKKSVIFYDDYEYKIVFYLSWLFSSIFVVPKILDYSGKGVKTFNGYKELAYLHQFIPSEAVLQKSDLTKNGYVFIRHVASSSLNYRNQDCQSLIQEIVGYLCHQGIEIVASVEDERDYDLFPHAHIIQEPCDDIHSLIFFARCVISSGDTVAREGAIFGVPTLYIGKRDMRIHREFITMGRLQCPPESETLHILEKTLISGRDFQRVHETCWEDTTSVILQHLEQGEVYAKYVDKATCEWPLDEIFDPAHDPSFQLSDQL